MVERCELDTVDSVVLLADVEVVDEGLKATGVAHRPAHSLVDRVLVALGLEVLVRVPQLGEGVSVRCGHFLRRNIGGRGLMVLVVLHPFLVTGLHPALRTNVLRVEAEVVTHLADLLGNGGGAPVRLAADAESLTPAAERLMYLVVPRLLVAEVGALSAMALSRGLS